MRHQKWAMALVGLSAYIGGAHAADFTIASDETVTGADIAQYVDADIHIAEGKTLCFLNPSVALTFTGKLTGQGAFVVKSDTENVSAPRITFAGDATGLTGGGVSSSRITR